MISTILSTIQAMPADDYVGFTFFVGCMAMMAASAFFFLSMSSVEGKWKTSPVSYTHLTLPTKRIV